MTTNSASVMAMGVHRAGRNRRGGVAPEFDLALRLGLAPQFDLVPAWDSGQRPPVSPTISLGSARDPEEDQRGPAEPGVLEEVEPFSLGLLGIVEGPEVVYHRRDADEERDDGARGGPR